MNYFLAQAQNNQWANRRLLSACLALSYEEYVATRTGFFPSIERTLLHILDVDQFYLAALNSDFEAQNQVLLENMSLEQIVRLQSALDDKLIAFCERLDQPALSQRVGVARPQGIVMEHIDRLLLHVFQHQIHHRGQVHTMLSGTRVAPPQLDEFYLDGDAELRESDEVQLTFPSNSMLR